MDYASWRDILELLANFYYFSVNLIHKNIENAGFNKKIKLRTCETIEDLQKF